MSLNPEALDRYITGNYGEDQFPAERDFCIGPHQLTYLGKDEGQDVYACRRCGDLYDRRYCQRFLRSGNCGLDLNHKGRCSTVVFYCDACGKMRRGHPAGQALDLDGVPDVEFCFLCVRGK